MTAGNPQSGSTTVSVVVPCFNLGRYVDEAVQSVLRQTYRAFEIVIVDDGSTDPFTKELLRDYDRPRTRVIHTDNRGLAAARNLGISVARGAYLCMLDADDVLLPTHLEKTVRVLEENASIAFASCWLETFGDENWIWRQDRCDLPALLAECTVCTAALVRSSAVLAVGGFDERMPLQGYEDWDLWLTLVEHGFRGVIIPEVLFRYRRRAGSMSSVCCHGEAHLTLMQYLISKHADSYGKHLLDVLMRKETDVAALLRSNYEEKRHLEAWLKPEIERRREEPAQLQARLERAAEIQALTADREHAEAKRQALESELDLARTELAVMRRSRSWRVTAPLRVLYDALRGFVRHTE